MLPQFCGISGSTNTIFSNRITPRILISAGKPHALANYCMSNVPQNQPKNHKKLNFS